MVVKNLIESMKKWIENDDNFHNKIVRIIIYQILLPTSMILSIYIINY